MKRRAFIQTGAIGLAFAPAAVVVSARPAAAAEEDRLAAVEAAIAGANGYVDFDGVSYADTPAIPAWTPASKIDIRVDVAPTDATPPFSVLVAHWNIFGGERSWMMNWQPSGRFNFELGTSDGTAWLENFASSAFTLGDGERRQHRVVFDGDDGAGGRRVEWFHRLTTQTPEYGTGWELLRSETRTGTFTDFHASTDRLTIAANNDGTGNRWAGRFYHLALFVDDVLVASPRVENTEFVDPLGNEWTLKNNAHVVPAGSGPIINP